MDLAQQAETSQDGDRAAELYRRAHLADPYNSAALVALGRLAVRTGAATEAAAYFEAALALDGRDRAARHGLADAMMDLDRGDDALAIFEALLAENAGDGRAWNGKGAALDLVGRHDDAQTAYRAGLALLPNDPEIRENLDMSRTLAVAPAEPASEADGVTLALNTDSVAGTQDVPPPHSSGRDP